MRPIVIVHGWSGSARSFQPLAIALHRATSRPIQIISLANYVSRDDDLTIRDLVEAMHVEWRRQGLPMEPGSVDVIAHSMGGLIVRDWVCSKFANRCDTDLFSSPIKHLVMLAPANFGSHLAHKGRSFLGRVIKGWSSENAFEVGEQLLHDLELASPYQWQLAMQDRFTASNVSRNYGVGRTLCTVLTGNTGFDGIAAAANEQGSDGTVRVPSTNLNCAYLRADFTHPENPIYQLEQSIGQTAFGVLDGEDHGSITGRVPHRNSETLSTIVTALAVTDDKFPAWCSDLNQITHQTLEKHSSNTTKHGYQNTVFYVHDQFGQPVHDYFVDFSISDRHDDWFESMFQCNIIRTVHTNTKNAAYRSVMADCSTLYNRRDKAWEPMQMSLLAQPAITESSLVGFDSLTSAPGISLSFADMEQLFQPNRTMLIEVVLQRKQSERLFRIRPAG